MVLSRAEDQIHGEVPVDSWHELGRAAAAPCQRSWLGPVRAVQIALLHVDLGQGILAIVRSGFEMDADMSLSLGSDDPSEHHRAQGIARKSKRLSTFDDAIIGDPAASPDQGSRLVISTPHEAGCRSDRVGPHSTDEGGE